MRLIVTRPARDAARWCDDLHARGIDAVALPLIAIGPARSGDALVADAWKTLAGYQAAMFVSSNAVAYFHAPNRPFAQVAPGQAAINTRAWAPGPGTARALIDAGWPASRVDGPAADAAQFDSEALWIQVAAQIRPGGRVLIVRGEEGGGDGDPAPSRSATSSEGRGRDWLRARLSEAGASVDAVAVYARYPPLLDAAQQALARQAADGADACWLFSSSDAVRNLLAAVPGIRWNDACAIATHPRIADAARAAGFGHVESVPPTLNALAALLAPLGRR